MAMEISISYKHAGVSLDPPARETPGLRGPAESRCAGRFRRRLECRGKGAKSFEGPYACASENCCPEFGHWTFPAFHFVLTRLNPAGGPTRDTPLPVPALSSFSHGPATDELYEGLALLKVRRWAANSARLALLLFGTAPGLVPGLGWRVHHRVSKIFDSTLISWQGASLLALSFQGWFSVLGRGLPLPCYTAAPELR